MHRILFILFTVTFSLASRAACIDVVDLSVELPAQITTNGGVLLSYQYDLQQDQYALYWQKGNIQSDVFGPFPLTMACGTPAVRWENDNFLILERGCGTFCWYVKIFRLPGTTAVELPDYLRIDRPLAFDADRNLIAYYYDQDLIRVRDLDTGIEQEIRTKYACQYYSGLCFGDVAFNGATLEYSWHEGQAGVRLSSRLEDEFMAK